MINHMKNAIGRLRLVLRQPPEISSSLCSKWLMKAFERVKNNILLYLLEASLS
jgi:hypothetical protein